MFLKKNLFPEFNVSELSAVCGESQRLHSGVLELSGQEQNPDFDLRVLELLPTPDWSILRLQRGTRTLLWLVETSTWRQRSDRNEGSDELSEEGILFWKAETQEGRFRCCCCFVNNRGKLSQRQVRRETGPSERRRKEVAVWGQWRDSDVWTTRHTLRSGRRPMRGVGVKGTGSCFQGLIWRVCKSRRRQSGVLVGAQTRSEWDGCQGSADPLNQAGQC